MAKGSIEKRGENTWRLTIDLGYNQDGSRNRLRRKVVVEDKTLLKTKKKLREHLEDELAKFKQEVLSGEYIKPEKMTLKQFIENEWEPKYASKPKNLSPLTYKTYMHHIENHIMPTFGHKFLGDIKTLHIVTFIDDLGKPGSRKDNKGDTLSPGTIQFIYRVLKNILTRATEWQLIKSNPTVGVKKPKVEQTQLDFYDEKEAREVIKALYQEPRRWRLLILGAMLGGCRRGELVGLEWSDVDFENKTISIRKSISLTVDSRAIEKEPKSKSSIRTIDMPQWYMVELKEYEREWKKKNCLSVINGSEAIDDMFFTLVWASRIFIPTHRNGGANSSNGMI
ncbi:site-specific integrase [Paenibacillus larvae]|nr:site-specific integrase [Paenibacillus larvae]MDT2247893.1 site-specific integrase [Paenibacillus larvae]MDT2284928.1 site-specific integrase [Paenibacillus larvae]MDT2305087.1 site-specific integrase [Paenibacillus larvae]